MGKEISIANHFEIYFFHDQSLYDSEMLFLSNNLNNWKLNYRRGPLWQYGEV